MQKYALILLFISSLFAKDLYIASWNIRFANEKDSLAGNAWSKRMPEIAKVISYQDFQIIALQEPVRKQADDLLQSLPEYQAIILPEDSSEGNLILYKANELTVLDQGRFWLSKTPEIKSKSWDAKHYKMCVWAKFKSESDSFFVFNIHLDNKGKEARTKSSKLILKKVKEIAGSSPAIILGDFNSHSVNDSHYNQYKNSGFLISAEENAEISYSPNASYNAFAPERKEIWQLDHIFTTKHFKIHRFSTLDARYFDGEIWRYPSDHSPIEMRATIIQ